MSRKGIGLRHSLGHRSASCPRPRLSGLPILLGGGRPFLQALPEHVQLNLIEAVPAPGVTHLHYEVVR
ncbi:MAG: hypothetical protein ABSG95_15580 [Solirubrobacteraceae bacterium]